MTDSEIIDPIAMVLKGAQNVLALAADLLSQGKIDGAEALIGTTAARLSLIDNQAMTSHPDWPNTRALLIAVSNGIMAA